MVDIGENIIKIGKYGTISVWPLVSQRGRHPIDPVFRNGNWKQIGRAKARIKGASDGLKVCINKQTVIGLESLVNLSV
jgi:hypothetical protein